jgi:hypothetical protein
MSVAVKPHQAFFLAARTDYAAGLVPTPFASLLSSGPSFPAAALPQPRVKGGRRRGKKAPRDHPHAARWAVRPWPKRFRSAGVLLGPGARPERPSIRVGPAAAPSTCYRLRVERPARHKREPTHRTNGAFAGSPGGTTAALSDLAWPTPAAAAAPPYPSAPLGPALDTSSPSHGAAAAAPLACRRAVELTRSRQSFSSAPAGTSPRST